MVDHMARARAEFLHSGATSREVPTHVATSWQRCREWSVRPEAVEPPYQPDVNPESRLHRAAGPVLDAVQERLDGLGVSFLISDPDGTIVERRVQNVRLLHQLDRLGISPGHMFAEEAVGTNGIGTAVELGRTTRIEGHEHYRDAFVDFTCVGAPVLDPLRRRPLGILDLTVPADPHNPMLELIAEQTALAISERLLQEHSAVERALLEHFLSANSRTRGGLVVLSDRILLANPQAARLFNDIDHPIIWDHAARALTSHDHIDGVLDLPGGRTIATRTSALHDGGDVIGSLMEIRPTPLPRTARRAGARPAVTRPPGLVGSDRAILAAYTAGRAALPARPVVVSGERGAGKAALGRALLDGADVAVLDCATATLHGEKRLLREIGALLRVGRGLLLCRADLLSARTTRRLVPHLASAARHRTPCVVTYACGRPSDADPFLDLDAERVHVPPLRSRLPDLPQLVAAAGGDRIAPEVVQLFLRLLWPGNVRQLHEVVRTMVREWPTGVISLAAVPPEIRRAAPRRPLSRFEQAEIHTVLDALAETNGNKRAAAELLGISRATLYRKLQNAGIDLENTVY